MVDNKHRCLRVFLILFGVILFLNGCGGPGADQEISGWEPVSVTVLVIGSDDLTAGRILARSIPQNISSLALDVYDTYTSALIYTNTVNKQQGEDPVTFFFSLPGGATYNFIARAYSQTDGNGDLLYQGTTSGVSIYWGAAVTVDINLGLVGTLPPSVITDPAGDVTSSAATLAGLVNPNGFETVVYFEWGLDTNYGVTTPIQQAGSGIAALPIMLSISGLSPKTTYHYRLVASSSGNIVYGNDQQFTTLPVPPIDTYFSLAVTENSHNHAGARTLFLDFQDVTPDRSVIQNNVVISPRVNQGDITLDGNSSDWDTANMTIVSGLVQNNYPLSEFIDAMPTEITVGSAWDGVYIYFLVQWEDTGYTASTKYAKWVFGEQGRGETGWNPRVNSGVTPGAPNENAANAGHLLAGAESEDRIFMMFPIADGENNFIDGGIGCAAYCHSNLKDDNPFQNYTGMGVVAMHTNLTDDTADILHWKSSRTAPSGYSDDQLLIYAAGSDNGRISDSGSAAYLNNPLVSGNPAYRHSSGLDYTGDILLLADAVPFDGTPLTGDLIPSIISMQPGGSRGDVESREYYDPVSHRWTVEFRRLIDTGNSDDHQFNAGTNATPPASAAVATVNPVMGETLYNDNCASCHGTNGVGSVAGNTWAFPRVQRTSGSLILKAIQTVGVMQGLAAGLSEQDVEDIAAFLQTQATFAPAYSLSVNVTGVPGTSIVTSDPAGINCPGTCSFDYIAETSVTLTANNVPGYTFTGWSGGSCIGTGTCVVILSSDQSVTANYTSAATTYTLTVTNAANGTVTSTPSGIACGTDCTETYAEGTSIILTATPADGYGFDGWTGDVCGGATGQCVFTISADTNLSALFTPITAANCENGGVTFDVNGTNGFGLQQMINNSPLVISNPTDVAFIPGGGGAFLVTSQEGWVYYYNGGCDPVNSIDLRNTDTGGIGVVSGGEQGLLNVEFHPDFSLNGYVFFFHTSVSNSVNSVSRMTLTFDGNGSVVLSDPVKIIDFLKTDTTHHNHNGGGLVFAPDKTLLASVGDGGTSANGQLNNNLLGVVIRINPELMLGAGGYTISSGNMFNPGNPKCSNVVNNSTPCPEILAMGLRNPFRMSIDGNIVYMGDVGSSYEEINSFDYRDATINFGWPTYDGTANQIGYRDPILAYRRDDATAESFRCEDPEIYDSVTGTCNGTGYASLILGQVYRGSLYNGQLTGRLFHAEFMDGYMRALGVDTSGSRTDMGMHVIHHDGISAMIEGPDGYVYIVTQGGAWGTTGPDMVYRLVKP